MELTEKAIKLATIYQQNKKIEGILLAGSVSRGWQDQHSDIEIHIFWSEPPSDEERLAPIEMINGKVLDFFPYEEEEWSESYLTEDNIKLEISNFLVGTVQKYIEDVIKRFNIDFDKQCMVASVFYGKSLYGEELLNRLKQQVKHYPPLLAENMINSNLELGSRWNNRKALLDRKDWLMLYEVMCTVQQKLLAVLFGINKLYVHHPAFKWLHHIIDLMEVKPENLDLRLTKILMGDIHQSIPDLELLIEEILALVNESFPHIDIEPYKQKAKFVRPENG